MAAPAGHAAGAPGGARFSFARALAAATFAAGELALAALPAPAATDTLAELADLARGGAPHLALELMDRRQPDLDADPSEWLRFERERLYVLRRLGAWEAAIERLERFPDALPESDRRWAALEAAKAHLELGEGAVALARLRRLIWSEAPATGTELETLRRLVIRAYLAAGRVDDAHTAMLRFRQDYGDGGPGWARLQARVLLRGGRAAEAVEVLRGLDDPRGRALRLHARLAAGGGAPAEIDAAAEQLLAEIDAAETEDPGTRALLWAVRAWAAAARGEPGARIAALEALLRLPEQVRSRDEFVAADADTLWDAWLAYGKALGNRKHLLVGDDGPWYFAASEAYDERPFEARGLFAVLALTSRDAEHRALAHEYFADLTRQRPGGLLLLRRLYLESGRFPSHAAVPEAVRHALVDQALNAGDIDLASELTAGLTEPPPGADRVQWRMRRARALLLGGHPAAGLEALEALVADAAELEGEGLDRLVQILFDLQNLERHAKAVELFERLLALELDAKRRRELLFWTADSYRALDRHARAALYYLRSATLPDPFAMDRWAQSARFQAAESLVRAGYLEDARRLYRGLLNVTKDPAQRALLRRKIEQVEARE